MLFLEPDIFFFFTIPGMKVTTKPPEPFLEQINVISLHLLPYFSKANQIKKRSIGPFLTWDLSSFLIDFENHYLKVVLYRRHPVYPSGYPDYVLPLQIAMNMPGKSDMAIHHFNNEMLVAYLG